MTDRVDTSLYWHPPSPFDVVYLKEIYGICRARLTEQQRDIFEAFFDGLSQIEIAETLGVSMKTVLEIIATSSDLLRQEFSKDFATHHHRGTE